MDKISTILVPFDFSDSAIRALEYAAAFVGRKDDIRIILAHIGDLDEANGLPERFTEIREKYGRILKNKPEWTIQRGTLTEALLNIQRAKTVDLVIMGTLGGGNKEEFEHSNTSELVLAADCPVLVVPPGALKFPLQRIALVMGREAIDDVDDLGALLEVARRFNARVHVVTIANQPGVYGYSEVEESNENAMEYYLEDFYSEHVFIRDTDVVRGILEYASKKEIDLIAILPRNHTRNSDPSDGRLTQLLALRSRVPLLAVD